MAESYPEDWELKAAWMRARGATSAEWTASGALDSVTLGPEPPPKPSDEEPTQQTKTREDIERAERDQRRRLVERSSGGPVLRVGGDKQ